jgi:hypothetical protein
MMSTDRTSFVVMMFCCLMCLCVGVASFMYSFDMLGDRVAAERVCKELPPDDWMVGDCDFTPQPVRGVVFGTVYLGVGAYIGWLLLKERRTKSIAAA